MSQFNRSQSGQGMTEYIIMVALIAIAAIGVYGLFGGTLQSQVAGMAQDIAGDDSSGARDQAKSQAAEARDQAGRETGLGNYSPGE